MATRPHGRPKAVSDKTDQNTVQALDRALGLLEQLAHEPGLTLSQLAESSGLPVATVFRALVTLQSHGMVEVEEPGQFWHVGVGAFRVGTAFLRRTQIAERAQGAMEALVRDTGETASVGVDLQGEVLFLAQVETSHAIRAHFPPGTRAPMHASAIGKALLAWHPAAKVEAVINQHGLPKLTTLTLTSAGLLQRDMSRTRDRGFAVDDQEQTEGMRSVAAPIFGSDGRPVAGLSVSGPAFRLALSDTSRIGRLVVQAADQVTISIGGQKP